MKKSITNMIVRAKFKGEIGRKNGFVPGNTYSLYFHIETYMARVNYKQRINISKVKNDVSETYKEYKSLKDFLNDWDVK